jgi:hypothetical protein
MRPDPPTLFALMLHFSGFLTTKNQWLVKKLRKFASISGQVPRTVKICL